MTVVILTTASASPWSRPSDWGDPGSVIELVGAGGNSNVAAATSGGTAYTSSNGGGGGAYGKLTFVNGTLGATTNFQIKAFNGTTGPTGQDNNATLWLASATPPANCYVAQAGAMAAGTVGAPRSLGGTARLQGTVSITYSVSSLAGGSGGITGTVRGGGAGGGGGGGPRGAGGRGGDATAVGGTVGGAGGGGGNNGGIGVNGTLGAAGAGGSGANGAGGAAGISGSETGKSGGTTGGGGGGGFSSGTAGRVTTGGTGGTDITYSGTIGIGGGGGGAGANFALGTGAQTSGGNGGLGGGGAGGPAGTVTGTLGGKIAGVGGAGFIVITYSPTVTSRLAVPILIFGGMQSNQASPMEFLETVSQPNLFGALAAISVYPVSDFAISGDGLESGAPFPGTTPIELLYAARVGTPVIDERLSSVARATWMPAEFQGAATNNISSYVTLPLELLTSVSGITKPWAEVLTNVRRTVGGEDLEWLASQRAVGGPQDEFLHGLVGAGGEQVESLHGLANGFGGRLEYLAGLRNGIVLSPEQLTGAKGAGGDLLEYLATVRPIIVPQIEWLGTTGTNVSALARINLEFLTGIAARSGDPVEQLTGVRLLGADQVELLANVRLAIGTAQAEFLGGVRARPGLQDELIGNLRAGGWRGYLETLQNVTGRGGDPLEQLLAVGPRIVPQLELTSTVTTVLTLTRLPIELLGFTTVTSLAYVPIELLAAIAARPRLNPENTSNLRSGVGGSTLELLANVRSQLRLNDEILANVRGTGGDPVELLAGMVGAPRCQIELTGNIRSITATANDEIMANVAVRSANVRDEILLNVQFRRAAQDEWLASIRGLSSEQVELLATNVPVTARALFPLEVVLNVQALSPEQVEFLSTRIAKRIDRFTLKGVFQLAYPLSGTFAPNSQLKGTFQITFPLGGKVHNED